MQLAPCIATFSLCVMIALTGCSSTNDDTGATGIESTAPSQGTVIDQSSAPSDDIADLPLVDDVPSYAPKNAPKKPQPSCIPTLEPLPRVTPGDDKMSLVPLPNEPNVKTPPMDTLDIRISPECVKEYRQWWNEQQDDEQTAQLSY